MIKPAAVLKILSPYNLQLKINTPYHWQILAGNRILSNIWPTKNKKLDWWPVVGTAVEFPNDLRLLTAIEKLVGEYAIQFATLTERTTAKKNKRQPAKRQAPLPPIAPKPQQEPEPEQPVEEYTPNPNRRIATLDMSMEGAAMRLIINSHTYSDSFRLTPEDTLSFLAKAAAAFAKLKKTGAVPCPPTTSD